MDSGGRNTPLPSELPGCVDALGSPALLIVIGALKGPAESWDSEQRWDLTWAGIHPFRHPTDGRVTGAWAHRLLRSSRNKNITVLVTPAASLAGHTVPLCHQFLLWPDKWGTRSQFRFPAKVCSPGSQPQCGSPPLFRKEQEELDPGHFPDELCWKR